MKENDKKDFMEVLEKINSIMEKMGANINPFGNRFEEANNEACTLSITKKEGNNPQEIRVEGSTPAILLNLAGLEKAILEKLEVPQHVFEMVKNSIGTREADNE